LCLVIPKVIKKIISDAIKTCPKKFKIKQK